ARNAERSRPGWPALLRPCRKKACRTWAAIFYDVSPWGPPSIAILTVHSAQRSPRAPIHCRQGYRRHGGTLSPILDGSNLGKTSTGEVAMNSINIPQWVIDRIVAKYDREHVYEDLDPAKTALVVVDMQNTFMLPEVAHALCPEAVNIVPNLNRLARVVRETG